MQLYVTETVCVQRPILKASRNSNKLEKNRIHQKGDLYNSIRIKLLRLEVETYNSLNEANFLRQRHIGFFHVYFLIYF